MPFSEEVMANHALCRMGIHQNHDRYLISKYAVPYPLPPGSVAPDRVEFHFRSQPRAHSMTRIFIQCKTVAVHGTRKSIICSKVFNCWPSRAAVFISRLGNWGQNSVLLENYHSKTETRILHLSRTRVLEYRNLLTENLPPVLVAIVSAYALPSHETELANFFLPGQASVH